ncbi:MAG: SDR family oxidoreductase [Alphaproteobacteria bacterium]|nr:SDR family oxidoreductase [Alphaproteobacteria bacterium]
MTKKLAGKVALISGSGRGIGQAIALKLAAEGARVVVNDLDAGPANDIAARIRQAGGEAAVCTGDVAAADFGERFVKTALERFGGLDIIVNNAGFTWDSVIQKMSDEQWQTILDVHLTAPFRILRAASEPIRIAAKKEKEEGRAVHRKVVNVSSISGLFGNAGQVNYSAAKSALIGMTRTLAKEWGRYNVNVNCVAFGYIKTRMTQELSKDQVKPTTIEVAGRELPVGIQPEMIKAMERMIPLGRGGTPEEAADAVYLFCTPESNYISGQVVLASGGLFL